jgi:hypothetical protein
MHVYICRCTITHTYVCIFYSIYSSMHACSVPGGGPLGGGPLGGGPLGASPDVTVITVTVILQ